MSPMLKEINAVSSKMIRAYIVSYCSWQIKKIPDQLMVSQIFFSYFPKVFSSPGVGGDYLLCRGIVQTPPVEQS